MNGATTAKPISSRRASTSLAGAFSIVVALCALLSAPLLAWGELGLRGLMNLLAPDSFYYLSIAIRSNELSALTFDGTYATNGFHPLWQFLLFALVRAVGHDSASIIVALAVTSILLTSVAYALIIYATQCSGKQGVLSAILIIPGVMSAFTLATQNPVLTNHSPWIGFNGMESSLSLAVFGIMLMSVVGKPSLPIGRLSLILPWIVLARLDDVFLPIGLAIAVLWSGSVDRANVRKVVILVGPTVGILVLYFVFNLLTVGQPFPTSGYSKTSFALVANLSKILGSIFPLTLPFLAASVDPNLAPALFARSAQNILFKVATLVIPAVIALTYLKCRWRSTTDGAYPVMLLGLAFYVLLKTSCTLAFFDFREQGAWYWAVTGIVASILVLELAPSRVGKAVTAALACGALFLVSTGVPLLMQPQPFRFFELWHERSRIQADLDRIDPGLKLIEMDDGIINFSLRSPTLSGFGLALDPVGARAFRQGNLLDIAEQRGYNAIATSFYLPLAHRRSAEEIDAGFRSMLMKHGQDPGARHFRLIYSDPVSGLVVARIIDWTRG